MTDEEYRNRFYQRLVSLGCDPVVSQLEASGAEIDPDTAPEDAADDDLWYVAEDMQ